MSRTTVTPFTGKTTRSVTLTLPQIDIEHDYSILERNPVNGETVLSNVDSDPTLNEIITFGWGPLKSVNVNTNIVRMYDPSTKEGIQMYGKDEWMERTTEDDGTKHDDPFSIHVVLRATKGANIPDGSVLLPKLLRIVAALAPVVSDGSTGYTLDTDTLDRLLHGVSKPSAAS